MMRNGILFRLCLQRTAEINNFLYRIRKYNFEEQGFGLFKKFERKQNMKKILAFVFTVALAVTAFATTALAADDSPQKLEGVITAVTAVDADGNKVDIELAEPSGSVSDFDTALAELKQTTGNDLKIIDFKAIRARAGVPMNFPIDVEFKIPGIKASSKGYILFKDKSGDIEKLDAVMGDGTVKVTVKEEGEFVFVADSGTVTDIGSAGSGDVTSPVTGDNTLPVMSVMIIAAGAVGIFAVKKIKAAK